MGLRKTGGNWVEGDRFFVDLEDAPTAADAVVEIAAASREVRGSWNRVKDWIAKSSTTAIDRVDELGVSELRVKLRFGIDAGSWSAKGDALFASLAASEGLEPILQQAGLSAHANILRMVLGDEGYGVALELLTEAAVSDGILTGESIRQYGEYLASMPDEVSVQVKDVLHVLEHDGYLTRRGDGYRFVSGLVEDRWRARQARGFVPFSKRLA